MWNTRSTRSRRSRARPGGRAGSRRDCPGRRSAGCGRAERRRSDVTSSSSTPSRGKPVPLLEREHRCRRLVRGRPVTPLGAMKPRSTSSCCSSRRLGARRRRAARAPCRAGRSRGRGRRERRPRSGRARPSTPGTARSVRTSWPTRARSDASSRPAAKRAARSTVTTRRAMRRSRSAVPGRDRASSGRAARSRRVGPASSERTRPGMPGAVRVTATGRAVLEEPDAPRGAPSTSRRRETRARAPRRATTSGARLTRGVFTLRAAIPATTASIGTVRRRA